MTTDVEPDLADTHPLYPDGFPERLNDDLLGAWETAEGRRVIVAAHPHGYELHFGPCEECKACEAGEHRYCVDHQGIVTVAGGEEGHAAVLEYLAMSGSQPHIIQHAQRLAAAADAEEQQRLEDQAAHEEMLAERAALEPSREERLAAIEAEVTAMRAEGEA